MILPEMTDANDASGDDTSGGIGFEESNVDPQVLAAHNASMDAIVALMDRRLVELGLGTSRKL